MNSTHLPKQQGKRWTAHLSWGLYLLVFILTGCSISPEDLTSTGRPACVALDSYSGVIQQVMEVYPDWSPLEKNERGFVSNWTILEEEGEHILTAQLNEGGCVCATSAKSQFKAGTAQGEMSGNFQGAAVAPISELPYTKWLDRRVLINCPLTWFFRRSYQDSTVMDDGTTWMLSCSRTPGQENPFVRISLTVETPQCLGSLK